MFQPAQPIGTGADTRLQVELAFRTGHPNHALGRFRLSVTDRPVPSLEPSLMRLKADSQQNGLTRLAAAYYLRGEWASARAVLERSAERPVPRPWRASCWRSPSITWGVAPLPGVPAIAPSSG